MKALRRPALYTITLTRFVNMADAPRSVTQYLSQIETNTKKYLEYFTSQGLPEPSFEKGDGLNPELPLPSHIIAVRDAAVEAADELHHLFLGPLGLLLSSPGDVRIPFIVSAI